MNTKYHLTLHVMDKEGFQAVQFDHIRANDLVSLLSQLIVLIPSLHRREMEEHGRPSDDDDLSPF